MTRIGVDARELAGRATGVGRYLAELLACWSRDAAAAGHRFVLFSPSPLALPPGLIGSGGATIDTVVVPGNGSPVWEQMKLGSAAARQKVDVLFCPGYSGPLLSRVPMAVTMHDVSFCAHPEWFRAKEGVRRRTMAWASAQRARRVIAVSRFSRDEIMRLLGVSADKIRVIPQGVGGFFDPVRPAGPAPTGPRGPLVLFVGSIFNRRHLPLLLRAFAPLSRDIPSPRLVIVGDNRTYPYEDLDALAQGLGIAPQVRMAKYVTDEELAELYGEARAFAFLSEYEGFGMTPLEALAAGVPSVLLDTPVAREVFEEAALFVPLNDEVGVTAALRVLLGYDAVRTHLLAQGAPLVARYRWSHTATLTLAALQEAAGA